MKIFKIIVVNLIVILVIFSGFEFYFAKKWETSLSRYFYLITHSLSVEKYYDLLFKNEYVNMSFTPEFRPDMKVENIKNKKPILFMGCSYTWGDGIEENQTVSYKMAEATSRPIYNRAGNGWGLAQFLYLSKHDYLYNTIPEPEYIFYIWIEDHKNRIDKFKIDPNSLDYQPKYKIVNNKLVEEKPHFFDKLFFVSHYQYNYNYKYNKNDDNVVKLYFEEAEKEIHKHWKDTKLVILLYPTCHGENQNDNPLWKDLSKENYEIINLEDLTDIDLVSQEYKAGDGWHPAAEVWEILTPILVKKFNL